jgi:opacity protein-like surface antigen
MTGKAAKRRGARPRAPDEPTFAGESARTAPQPGRRSAKRRLLAVVAAVPLATLLAVGTASADTDPAAPGWYGALDLGAHMRQDRNTTSELSELGAGPAMLRFHTNKNFAGFARVGDRVRPGLRFEIEGGWRPTDLKSVVEYLTYKHKGGIAGVCGDVPTLGDGPSPCPRVPGAVSSWSVLANGYYDFLPRYRLHPYVGVGVGVANVRLQAAGRLVGPATPGRIAIDDTSVSPAFQALGGLAYRIDDRWTADLAYRFFYAEPEHWLTHTTGAIPLGRISGDYMDHSLTLGLRYSLGPTPR